MSDERFLEAQADHWYAKYRRERDRNDRLELRVKEADHWKSEAERLEAELQKARKELTFWQETAERPDQ